MRGKTVKRLKKKLINNTEEMLLIIRNEYGSRTDNMTPKGVIRATKKLFKRDKIKI